MPCIPEPHPDPLRGRKNLIVSDRLKILEAFLCIPDGVKGIYGFFP